MMKPILLDIMIGDSWQGQLKYDKRGFPLILDDGTIAEVADYEELKRFALEKKPSLEGKDFRVEISTQRV